MNKTERKWGHKNCV